MSLATFGLLVVGGGLLFGRHYHSEKGPMGWVEGMYATLTLVFFNPSYPFPSVWYLQAMFFLVPLLGIGLVAEGVAEFLAIVVGRDQRTEDWQMALGSTTSDHVVVCGLGRIGFRVVQRLATAGEDMVVITRAGENPFVEVVREMGIPVVIADATKERVLESVGVARAHTIIIVTDDDLVNLETALDAREINPRIRVVMRMFNDQLVGKVKRAFNLELAFSTSALAAPVFAAGSASKAVRHSIYADDAPLEVAEFRIQAGCDLDGLTVAELRDRHPLQVLTLRRGDARTVFPAEDARVQAQDVITVVASLDTVKKLDLDSETD